MLSFGRTDGKWINRVSSRGEVYRVWSPSLMPRIQDDWLNSVFYLYPSRAEAEAGAKVGGSGFFVGVDYSGNSGRLHLYAVTNKHNIQMCKNTVVLRVTLKDGRTDCWESDPIDWTPSPDSDLSLLAISPEKAHLVQSVSDGIFVTRENFITEKDVKPFQHTRSLGPGDEVFMIGRFVSHDGGKKNRPSARFGNLSMLSGPMRHPLYNEIESFAVEMRSISGYSGSPVFIYWVPGGFALAHRAFHETFLGLLGVDWGHISSNLPVLVAPDVPHPQKWYVKSHTSMSGVVPAWKLRKLLDQKTMKDQRMKDEADQAKKETDEPSTMVLDSLDESAVPLSSGESPTHQEDFNRLLNVAAKTPKSDG